MNKKITWLLYNLAIFWLYYEWLYNLHDSAGSVAKFILWVALVCSIIINAKEERETSPSVPIWFDAITTAGFVYMFYSNGEYMYGTILMVADALGSNYYMKPLKKKKSDKLPTCFGDGSVHHPVSRAENDCESCPEEKYCSRLSQ